MGKALAVAENNLGSSSELPESAQQWRNFAKGEEPRDVGKGDVTLHLDEVHELKPGK
jgi:hypothetical protein